MTKVLSDLLIIPFFQTIIGLLLGIVVSYFAYKRPSRIKWKFKDFKNTKFVIATTYTVDTGIYLKQTTGIGQVYAFGRLISSFFKAYSMKNDPEIVFSENLSDNDLKSNLVIIGGIKNNKISKDLLTKCQYLPYTQETINDVDVIIDKRRSNNIFGHHDAGNLIDDFGLIISIPNPYNERTRALLFLSVHTYGLDAAAEVFTKQINIYKNLTVQNYVCLVKCKVNKRYITEPEMLDFVILK